MRWGIGQGVKCCLAHTSAGEGDPAGLGIVDVLIAGEPGLFIAGQDFAGARWREAIPDHLIRRASCEKTLELVKTNSTHLTDKAEYHLITLCPLYGASISAPSPFGEYPRCSELLH